MVNAGARRRKLTLIVHRGNGSDSIQDLDSFDSTCAIQLTKTLPVAGQDERTLWTMTQIRVSKKHAFPGVVDHDPN